MTCNCIGGNPCPCQAWRIQFGPEYTAARQPQPTPTLEITPRTDANCGGEERALPAKPALEAAIRSTSAQEVWDALDVAECCVHDQIKDPLEREHVQGSLKKIRLLALGSLVDTGGPIAIVEIKDICVGDDIGYLVLLKVGNQQFSIGDAYEKGEKDEAEWYAEMLRKALARAGART